MKPIINEPFTLTCPLESNPPSTYSWAKYSNLDRRILHNISTDVMFSDDGRQWRVDYYEAHLNGLYVCHASNSLGALSYSHDTVFFLHADRKFLPMILPCLSLSHNYDKLTPLDNFSPLIPVYLCNLSLPLSLYVCTYFPTM